MCIIYIFFFHTFVINIFQNLKQDSKKKFKPFELKLGTARYRTIRKLYGHFVIPFLNWQLK